MNDFIIIKILGKKARLYKKNEIKILDNAVILFASYGFHATKTKQIAKSANTSEGTIFNYFSKKEEILERLFYIFKINLLDNLVKEIEKVINEIDIEDFDNIPNAIKKVHMKYYQEYNIFFKAIIPELFHNKEYAKEIIDKYKEKMKSIIDIANINISKKSKDINYMDYKIETKNIWSEIFAEIADI